MTRKARSWLTTLAEVAGLVAIVAGVWLFSRSLGLIAAGFALIAVGVFEA